MGRRHSRHACFASVLALRQHPGLRLAAAGRRAVALKWIVHLVGDIHQPLHAADNGDRGGNDVRVRLSGQRSGRSLTLHRVWDDQLVRLALHVRTARRPPRDIATLAHAAEHLLRSRGEGTPRSWALDANRLARTVAYRYPHFACGRVPHRVIVLDGAHQRRAETVVRAQLLLAGARLAELLNRIFAAAPAPARRT
jgi:nuclease S1